MADGDSATPHFSKLSGLGQGAGKDAARELGEVCAQLRRVGASHAAKRIEDIDDKVGKVPFEALKQLIAPKRTIEDFAAHSERTVRQENSSGGRGKFLWSSVRGTHLVRNVLVLIPLITTWLMLGGAAWRYQGELNANPDAGKQPFLLLWQQRFGTWWFPSFAEVAVADVFFLLIVVVFTWRVHRAEHAAERAADQFAELLYDALGSLEAVVTPGRIPTPVAAEDLPDAIGRVMNEIRIATESLMKTSQQAVEAAQGAIEAVSGQLDDTLGKNQQFLADLQGRNQEFLADFQGTTQLLINEFKEAVLVTLTSVTDQNRHFIENTRETNQQVLEALVRGQIGPLLTEVQGVVNQFKAQQSAHTTAVTRLADGVGDIQASASGLAGSAQAFTGSTRSIADSLATMAGAQQRFASQVEESAQSMTTASSAMTEVKDALHTELHERLQAMTGNITGASDSLRDAQGSLATMASALATSARDLKDATASMRSTIGQLGPVARPRRRRWPGSLFIRRHDELGDR